SNVPGYSQMLSSIGGTGSSTFATAGPLPAGLILSDSGLLSGTPTVPGDYTFTVTATDATGGSSSQSYSIMVNPAGAIATPSGPDGIVAGAYHQTLGTIGGTGAVTFTSTGILPPGLSLSSTGVLSGTPSGTGSYHFTASAADTLGAAATQSYTITIR